MTSFDPDAAREGAAAIAKAMPTVEEATAGLAENARILTESAIHIAGQPRELWTTTQAAEHCGVKPKTFNDYRQRLGAPDPVDRQPGRSGQDLYDAAAVRAWHASRPGRGARTDLQTEPTEGSR